MVRAVRSLIAGTPILLLSGCKMVLLQPAGNVALQQRNLLIASTALLLLIIVPVLIAIAVIAYRYRHSNKEAAYAPEWEHSTKIELLIWAVPLAIIVALGAMTWIGTHTLDPYRPVERISASKPLPADAPVLNVEVVSLDWRWLFIYPDYGIATINQAAAPVDMPIRFKMTSENVMNSFFIPALAGQIMVMPAMQTQLSAIVNKAGDYKGISANFSGAGFSGMEFRFLGLDRHDFEAWVKKVKASGADLGRKQYLQLAKPSHDTSVHYYGQVAPDLYSAILNRCVAPGKMCLHQIMAIDARGGGGLHEGASE